VTARLADAFTLVGVPLRLELRARRPPAIVPRRAVSLHVVDVAPRRLAEPLDLVPAEIPHPLRRAPEHERPRRNPRPGRQERPGADETLALDHDTVEHDRADTDEAVVADGAPVEHGGVPHRDEVPHDGGPPIPRHVDRRIVLHVRPRPDPHRLDVPTHDRMKPDARLRPERHVPDDDGGIDDEGGRVDAGSLLSERGDHARCIASRGRRAKSVSARTKRAARERYAWAAGRVGRRRVAVLGARIAHAITSRMRSGLVVATSDGLRRVRRAESVTALGRSGRFG
jgi:hypothetical protein